MNNLLSLLEKTCFRNRTITCGNGFTLLEVVIGVAILSVGLLAVGTMQITSIRSNSFSHEFTNVLTFTVNSLEDLICTPFRDIEPGGDEGTMEGTTKLNYTRTWRIASLDKEAANVNKDADGDIDWKITEGEINWDDLGESPHKIILQTSTSWWD